MARTKGAEYFIRGHFVHDGKVYSLRKIAGKTQEVLPPGANTPFMFYYTKVGDEYSATIPSNGMHLYSAKKLKDVKQWIVDHWERLEQKLLSPEGADMEKWFSEAMDEIAESEEAYRDMVAPF